MVLFVEIHRKNYQLLLLYEKPANTANTSFTAKLPLKKTINVGILCNISPAISTPEFMSVLV